MKIKIFKKIIYCFVLLLTSTFYSQIVNEGTLKINELTTVCFHNDFTNKSTGNYTNNGELSVNNNFINNGTTASTAGTTFFNNTQSSQNIEGTSDVIFYNVTINNPQTVFQETNSIIENNFLINAGNSFKIAATKTLTINGTTSNLAGVDGLILASDETGNGSLLHKTSNVPATVERYISGNSEDWHFLSAPVSNQTINNSNWVPSGTYGNGTGYDLYTWYETSSNWVYHLNTTTTPNWATTHPQVNFVSGKGYLYAIQTQNPTLDFKGNLHNGSLNIELTAEATTNPDLLGFNLVGNPFASAIDWKDTSGWSRADLLDSAGGYDMWIWNPAANNYGVFNSEGTIGTNSVTQFIPPMQGFFVRAENNSTLTINNDVRVHTGANNWMKTNTKKNNFKNLKIKIASTQKYGFDEILVQFGHSKNKNGAAKLFSSTKTAPSLYASNNNQKLSVLYLSNITENPSIPINFLAGKLGAYQFSIEVDENQFEYLFLEDKIDHKWYNLLENSTVLFTSSTTDATNRFELYFMDKQSVLNDDKVEFPVFYDGKNIVVDLSEEKNPTELLIYDILGKQIFKKILNGQQVFKLPMNTKGQFYIIEAKNLNKTVRKKIAVY